MEYDFKTIYKTFDVSYLSNDKNLLNDTIVDSKELKNYESIEESKEDLIVILIRKFKLRISIRKNRNLSRHIFISEDYNFEPAELKHDDSIKIAIVKDNLDKWTNLDSYDYIFTFKEHIKELKEHGSVFPIEDTCVFTQIKFILNNLYKRKLNKFYYFLKEVDFQKVFPKTNDYFKVLNSDYFDYDWYRDTYGLKDNTDSVIHYLLIGSLKGYDPGPNFSVDEYYECNEDVKEKGVDALLHYERYGRKENRFVSFEDRDERSYDSILNSPYFDEDWYKRTYKLDEDEDAVNHYLYVGYAKGYNPGPDFSTHEYYECNIDVKRHGMNPLIHYERHGRNENRFVSFEDKDERSHEMILNSPYFDEDWYKSTYELDDEVDYADHYLRIGHVKRYNPGPDFSTQEYIELNRDVPERNMNPLVHYELFGRIQNRNIRFSDMQHKKDHDLILNSPYFDGEWYKSTYNIGDDVDPIDHYLSIGYAKEYNPGPNFSTHGYYERNIDVKRHGMNPLIHYERHGRNEGRKII